MKLVRLSLPLFLMVTSIIFFVSTLYLDRASIGDPNAVIYFPLLCSIGLFICGVIYLIQELQKRESEDNEDLQLLMRKKTLQTIIVIAVLCVIYTLTFEILGFILSTCILLGGLLFYLNGVKKWLMNIIITVASTTIFFVTFKVLLDVNLP